MDNENKWEYDYSSIYRQNGQPAPEAAQPSVAASENHATNQAGSDFQNGNAAGTGAAAQIPSAPAQPGMQSQPLTATAAQPIESGAAGPGTPQAGAAPVGPAFPNTPAEGYRSTYSYSGGSVPPYTPGVQPGAAGSAAKPPQRHGHGVLARILTLVLALCVGFGGGMLGGYFAGSRDGGTKVVMQTVERDTSAASTSTTSTEGNNLSLSEVSSLVTPSVVVITTEQMVSSGGWYGQNYVESGAGSGVIMSSDGYIMTCDHVISGASQITITIDGQNYKATVMGEDRESDIAVLKIDASGLTPAVMGNSDSLAVGEEVVAVGNPLGVLGGTVTNGIVSALNRNIAVQGQKMNLIQTSASVSPGNSGGGLFNMAGELIGIVNAKSSDTASEGLGFAIPINTAYKVAQDLIQNGAVTGRPALGITVVTINSDSLAAQYGVSAYGVYIAEIQSGAPAEQAGLQVGDRILSINGAEVNQSSDVTDAISSCQVGDTVSITVARDGKTLNMEVSLADKSETYASANGSRGGDQNEEQGASQSEEQGGSESTLPQSE